MGFSVQSRAVAAFVSLCLAFHVGTYRAMADDTPANPTGSEQTAGAARPEGSQPSVIKAWLQRRKKMVCGALVAGAILGAGTLTYMYHWSSGSPISMEVEHGGDGSGPVDRATMERRLALLDAALGPERSLRVGLQDQAGNPPGVTLFDKNPVQAFIAARIREGYLKDSGRQQPASGFTLGIERLEVEENPENAAEVFVYLATGPGRLRSESPIAKEVLLSGASVAVRFQRHVEALPDGRAGSATIEANIAIRFVPSLARFDITDGRTKFGITIPGSIDESDVAAFRASSSPMWQPQR